MIDLALILVYGLSKDVPGACTWQGSRFHNERYLIAYCPSGSPPPPPPSSVGPRVPTGPQAVACPGGAVNVTSAQNLQSVINTHNAGTTYCINAGTYSNQAVNGPKNGDVYFCQQGAIFDGGGTVSQAFVAPGGVSFTLQNCTVQNYSPPQQRAEVDVEGGGGNSLIKNNEIMNSAMVGVGFGGNDQVIANKIHDNQMEGYTCGGAISGIGTGGGTFTDNENFHNNPLDNPNFVNNIIEFGGGKCWQTSNMIYQFNWSHDNHGPGAWFDAANPIPNQGADIGNNLFENNWGQGLFWEVSGYVHIHNNVVRKNGSQKYPNFDPFDGQITISSGSGLDANHLIEIDHNTVTDNYCGPGADGLTPSKYGGITMMSQNRPDAPYRGDGGLGYNQTGTRFVSVHDNIEDLTNDGCGGTIGPDNDFGDTGEYVADAAHVLFDFNTYTNSAGKTPWWWNGGGGHSFSQWQGFGQDVHGTAQ